MREREKKKSIPLVVCIVREEQIDGKRCGKHDPLLRASCCCLQPHTFKMLHTGIGGSSGASSSESGNDAQLISTLFDKKEQEEVEESPIGQLRHGCEDHWTWNRLDCSHEVRLHGPGNRIALFHPNWSSGTAGVRGSRVLNNGRYYWEICLSHRIFGTSMMVGICTKKARLHADRFVNLLGEDINSWGLSHKGLLWHGGRWSPYARPFRENEATTIGLLFDGVAGTLTFYKDNKCLGVAFQGLDKIREPLYPVICSTAAKTEMTLANMRRDFVNLQDRCRAVIVTKLLQAAEDYVIEDCDASQDSAEHEAAIAASKQPVLDQLYLPPPLKNYLGEALQEAVLLQSMDTCRSSLRWHRPDSPRYNYTEGGLSHHC